MKSKEINIQSALNDLDSGVLDSCRAAGRAWAVPKSTIQHRKRGAQPHATAHSAQQRLSPDQEDYLVNWILEQDSLAQPLSHKRAREMATRILQHNGDYQPLGKKWLQSFLRRQ